MLRFTAKLSSYNFHQNVPAWSSHTTQKRVTNPTSISKQTLPSIFQLPAACSIFFLPAYPTTYISYEQIPTPSHFHQYFWYNKQLLSPMHSLSTSSSPGILFYTRKPLWHILFYYETTPLVFLCNKQTPPTPTQAKTSPTRPKFTPNSIKRGLYCLQSSFVPIP